MNWGGPFLRLGVLWWRTCNHLPDSVHWHLCRLWTRWSLTATTTEQLRQFEAMVREYERVSQTTYREDLKVAAILTDFPQPWEQVFRWWSQTAQHMRTSRAGHHPVVIWVSPSDAFEDFHGWWGNTHGGKKGKDAKGKGKKGKGEDGKGPWVSKGQWFAKGGKDSKGKSKGDSGKKGGKGKTVTCFVCGKAGHMAKDWWSSKKVQKVEEESILRPVLPALHLRHPVQLPQTVRPVPQPTQQAIRSGWLESLRVKTRMKVGIRIMRSQFFDFEEDGTCWHEVENVSVVNLVESVEADEEFHECFEVE